jgi:carbon starvation protein
VWLVAVTMTASYQKIFSPSPALGFLAQSRTLAAQIAAGAIPAARLADTHRLIFNARLDAAVTALLALMVLVLLFEAVAEWIGILRGTRPATLHESKFVGTTWAEGD